MAEASDATLAGLLRRLRTAARLTQEELAGAAGISTRSVSDLERGITRTTRKETARLLADALGLSGAARDVFEACARGRPAPGGPEAGQPAGLPASATPLIGRADEVRTCCEKLLRADVRLLTITGLGGVGKTRTAVQAGRQLAAHFPDGVRFVALAAVRDARLVPASIARALGLRESGTQPLADQLEASLAARNALLLLDNFEQVIDAAAIVARLLAVCPQVKFLVTSRRPLRVNGEHEYPLPPLTVPPAAARGPAELLAAPSVRLLTERIRAVLPGRVMTDSDVAAAAEICRRLDGLPLALELAAARAKVLPPAQLLARLDEHGDLLSLGARDADDRHRTLRSTLDWSYQLLDPGAARLLAELSVFAGGWTLEAMADVCQLPDEIEGLDALAALIDNSLVWRAERAAGIRFMLPATIGDYAAERLAAAGTAGALRGRHLDWSVRLAESAAAELTGPDQVSWLSMLGDEQANLRAALGHAVAAGDAQAAHRLAVALWRYWEVSGQLAEGRHWLARVLDLTGPVPPLIRGRTLRADGNLARDQGDAGAALSSHRQALAIFEQAGSDADVASALNDIGNVHTDSGEALAAIECYQASLRRIAGSGGSWLHALVQHNLALALGIAGRPEQAGRLAGQSLAAFQRLGDSRGVARATQTLAMLHSAAGDFTASLPLHQQAAATFWQVKDLAGVARAAEGVARASAALGDPAGAAWLLGYADALRERAGEQPAADEARTREETMAVVAAALTPPQARAAAVAGRAAPQGELPSLLTGAGPGGGDAASPARSSRA